MKTRVAVSRTTGASLTLFLTLLLVACGSGPAVESNSTPTSDSATIPSGTYTATFTDADNIRVGSTLMTGRIEMTFTESGHFTILAPEALISDRYTVSGDQVTFDEGNVGTFPCVDEPSYVYGWKLEGDRLTFSTIKDSCHARTLAMTGKPYVKN